MTDYSGLFHDRWALLTFQNIMNGLSNQIQRENTQYGSENPTHAPLNVTLTLNYALATT